MATNIKGATSAPLIKTSKRERLGDPNLNIGGVPQDELYRWAEEHIGRPDHKDDNKGCPFCK